MRRGRCAWGLVVALVAVGCGPKAAPEPVTPIVVPPPPETAPAPVAPLPPPSTPKSFADLGLTLDLPAGWTESLAPAAAGLGARLIKKADADLPALLIAGLTSREHNALRGEARTSQRDPFDVLAERMRDQILGSSTSAITPSTPLSVAATAGGRLISDKAWPSASLQRGRVLRYEGQDTRHDGTATTSYVDIYLGEAKGGSLYVLCALADDENRLDDVREVVDSVKVTGVRDTGPTLPAGPTAPTRLPR